MASGAKRIKAITKVVEKPVANSIQHQMAANASSMRAEIMRKLLTPSRDIDLECQYPAVITPQDYHQMYEREGVGTRATNIWAEESWSTTPKVYENEDPDVETEFEKVWRMYEERFHIFSVLERVDRLSGIGRFGILLLGIDDGADLSTAVEGVTGDVNFAVTKKKGTKRRLLYVRPFEEEVVDISTWEKDTASPRFGMPVLYNIRFEEDGGSSISKAVHWSRVVHIADNRGMSEIYGTPRMQTIYNRLLDVRKLLGGSGEMFWKGAFPGYSFKVDPEENVEIDAESMRKEMENYMNRLQRYVALTGVSVESMAVQVADPRGHLEVQLDAIALTLGIPKRILFGSEQAALASTQDAKTWSRRIARRQEGYVTPYIIRPLVDRLIEMGVLPRPAEYAVFWPDMTAMTDQEKAEVATKWADALSKYVSGGAEAVVGPEEFLAIFGGRTPQEIAQIVKGLLAMQPEDEHDHEGAVPETEEGDEAPEEEEEPGDEDGDDGEETK